jgi:hypothetical protein
MEENDKCSVSSVTHAFYLSEHNKVNGMHNTEIGVIEI